MKKAVILAVASLMVASSAYAVPDLQLFIAGGTYDPGTATWVTTAGDFDLYVVSANHVHNNVKVSLALAPTDDPSAVSVTFNGTPIPASAWVNGFAPLSFLPGEWNGGGDLPRHDIFPTWFTEEGAGNFDLSGHVGDVQPDAEGHFWNPATGTGSAPARGSIRSFHVDVGGSFTYVHFDAYTLNSDGSIDKFAPFSHDAEVNFVPEPGTLALFAPGLLGLVGVLIRKRKA